jgi:hypothetical protein
MECELDRAHSILLSALRSHREHEAEERMAAKRTQVPAAQLAETAAAAHQHRELPAADPLLTAEQAADLRNCCVTTVHRHAKLGLISWIPFGKRGRRFRRSALIAAEIPARKTRAARTKRGS